MTTSASRSVLFFDVMGTVVDLDGTARRTIARVLGSSSAVDADGVVQAWNAQLEPRLNAVVTGDGAWRPHRVIRAEALRAALDELGVSLPTESLTALDDVVPRAEPWPEAAAAMARLREVCTCVALSNAGVGELASLSSHGGLAWHGVISAELAHAFKPSAVVYEMALDLVNARPTDVHMVAAHPWDLRAAAACGIRTVYVARPDADTPSADDDFILTVDDLHALADQFGVPSR